MDNLELYVHASYGVTFVILFVICTHSIRNYFRAKKAVSRWRLEEGESES